MVFLNSDRDNVIGLMKQFVGDDSKFFELMVVAMNEIHSAALNGATLNDWKYDRLEKVYGL